MITKRNVLGLGLCLLGIGLLVGCMKDKVPAPEPIQSTKWELIAGQYNVYDTLGNFLYDMNIVHVPSDYSLNPDSLRFENFDGEFTFTTQQSTANNVPEYATLIGFHNPVYDSVGNRWRISSATNSPGYNYLENDSIILSFERSNLQYYIQDLTPYYECDCIQVAVKQ